jgi:hypothetical protein
MLTTCNTLQLHLWMIFNYLFVCIYCKGYIYYLFLVNVIVKSLLHLTVLLIEYFVSIYSTILSVRILPTDSRTEDGHCKNHVDNF